MRIAFLTGGVEPGMNGVGDYTSLLAAECCRQGHASCVLALNDTYVEDFQFEQRGEVPTLRFGESLTWRQRIEAARNMLDEFQPTCFSFQYVCYAYHPKGFAYAVQKWIQEIVGGAPLHMMFHELWIGAENGASMKHRLVGAAQRHFVKRMLRSLRPFVIHTSNQAYVDLLAQSGVAASVLPLFGLIPIAGESDTRWLYAEIAEKGLPITAGERSDYWLFGQFGSLYPVWQPEPLFSYLRTAAQLHGKKVGIISVGKIGSGVSLWESLCLKYADTFAFCRLGERSSQQVSQIFQELDFGIATTPWALIGKSAATASMLDHGLPVIVSRDDVQYPQNTSAPVPHRQLLRMTAELPTCLAAARRSLPDWRLPTVAESFCRALEQQSAEVP